jgi:hypothetical protein
LSRIWTNLTWYSTSSVKRSHKGHSFGCIATVYSLDTVFASCNLDLEFIHCWIVVLLNWFKFCSRFNLSNSRACLLCSLFWNLFISSQCWRFSSSCVSFFSHRIHPPKQNNVIYIKGGQLCVVKSFLKEIN